MIFQIQNFQIANLIFVSDQLSRFSVSSEDIKNIKNRFQSVVDYFNTSQKDYATGFVKYGGSKLPFYSNSSFGVIGSQFVLNFTDSYSNPIMLVYDTKKNTVRNYVDLKQASNILDDEIYDYMMDNLSTPKYLDRYFKGIPDINKFIEIYKDLLRQHQNKDTVTGMDCFEFDLNNV